MNPREGAKGMVEALEKLARDDFDEIGECHWCGSNEILSDDSLAHTNWCPTTTAQKALRAYRSSPPPTGVPTAREVAHLIQREMKLPCGFLAENRDEGDGWIRMATPHARDCDRLTAMIATAIEAARRPLLSRLEEAERLLREVEWEADGRGGVFCPICRACGSQRRITHDEGCRLRAFLAQREGR